MELFSKFGTRHLVVFLLLVLAFLPFFFFKGNIEQPLLPAPNLVFEPPSDGSTTKGYPVIIPTYNRPESLLQVIEALLGTEGVNPYLVTIFQDGNNLEVTKVIQSTGLRHYQHQKTNIDEHYSFFLYHAFQVIEAYHNAEGVIILEDDLIVSPDFFLYFDYTVPVAMEDHTIWCISTWNDNGKKHTVKDKTRIRRTDFMPGLGWFLPRWVYEEMTWPSTNWDWSLRDQGFRHDRQCLYPEISRNKNIGQIGGLHTEDSFQNFAFFNEEYPVSYTPSRENLKSQFYFLDTFEQIKNCSELRSLSQLDSSKKSCFFYLSEEICQRHHDQMVVPIIQFFDLYPYNLRAHYHGTIETQHQDNKVFIVFSNSPYYKRLQTLPPINLFPMVIPESFSN